MENNILNVISEISSQLATEKSYNIQSTCVRYSICNGEDFSGGSSSKEKYLFSVLRGKDDKFILDLAEKVIVDYDSDGVALSLNNYFEGKYFKISILTRQKLLSELFKIDNLNGRLTVVEFMKHCNLRYSAPVNFDDIMNAAFLGDVSFNKKTKDPELPDLLKELKLHEKRDQAFFAFLEGIVHPYARENTDSNYLIKLINEHLQEDGYVFLPTDRISNEIVYKVFKKGGVDNVVKNLIFASNGFKPDIVLDDALSNVIKIVKNEESCLIYEREIRSQGLTFVEMVDWYAAKLETEPSLETAKSLKSRLSSSLASPPEKVLFETYFKELSPIYNKKLPALIPQIYLHYDPYSVKRFGFQYLLRQRMDFLLLLPNNCRIVIEVDGKQHYSDGDIASPLRYAEMVSLDRDLKLMGYEVYRFGGYELVESNREMIKNFFISLFEKHGIS
ncbi:MULTISPECIES: hypothetical protein [Sphingobacterium]|uniref:AbiJ-related protein n=1 Tax=Sphingobacterium TaxID=28453 RepID=UPI0013DD4439|nr:MULTISPECIES: hypothetical protein [unclassified Sphingobacterium]